MTNGPIQTVEMGSIPCPSGRVTFADPMYVQGPDQCDVQLSPGEIEIVGVLFHESARYARVCSLTAKLRESGSVTDWKLAGTFAVDSATVVVADSDHLAEHFIWDGPDRIGYVVDVEDLCQALLEDFGLKSQPDDAEATMRIVGAVSRELEGRIRSYLAKSARYSAYPQRRIFTVKTNHSCDRVLEMMEPWGMLPIGNAPNPRMLVSNTGWGDGEYELYCGFSEGRPVAAKVVFMDEEEFAGAGVPS